MEERHIGFEIKTVSNLMRRKIENEVRQSENLTGNHTYILGFLYHQQNKDIFQKDIEQEFSIRRSTATGILNIMEKNGLLKRVSVDEDARLKKIILTKKGIEMHKQAFDKIQEFEKNLKKGLTDQELNYFFYVLDKIKNNIENC